MANRLSTTLVSSDKTLKRNLDIIALLASR